MKNGMCQLHVNLADDAISLLHFPPYELLGGRITQWFGIPPQSPSPELN